MKITLVNGWHDDNKGDSGIVSATIALIKEGSSASALSIVSTFSDKQEMFSNAHRHLLAQYPDLKIVGSPLPNHEWPKNGIYGHITLWLLKMFLVSVALIIGIRRQGGDMAIAEADLVISKGGHIFYNKGRKLRDWAQLIKHLYPLIVAWRFRVPFIIFGQSIGPFEGAVGRKIVRRVLSAAHAILVREEISYNLAKDLGLDMSKVFIVPDPAFYVSPDMTEKVMSLMRLHQLSHKKFWAVTVRSWPPGMELEDSLDNSIFLKEMAELISRALSSNLTERVAIVVHTRGPLIIEDDTRPSRRLHSMLSRFGDKVCVIDEDLLPEELVALYSSAKLLVGTRFHSVIFALAGGTPAFAISYFGPKAHGIMGLIGIRNACIDIDNFAAKKALWSIREMKEDLEIQIGEKIMLFRSELKRAMQKFVP